MSERAVSTTLGYVLALGITALLIAGILFAGGDYVGDQRERVIRSELQVLSQRLATDIESADRLNQTANATDAVRIDTTLPRSVGGLEYDISISLDESLADHPDVYRVTFAVSHPRIDYSESTTLGVSGDLSTGSIRGGDLRIVYVPANNRLEVRDE